MVGPLLQVILSTGEPVLGSGDNTGAFVHVSIRISSHETTLNKLIVIVLLKLGTFKIANVRLLKDLLLGILLCLIWVARYLGREINLSHLSPLMSYTI